MAVLWVIGWRETRYFLELEGDKFDRIEVTSRHLYGIRYLRFLGIAHFLAIHLASVSFLFVWCFCWCF